ncbi:hypothetical protein VNI00_010684 [Paramarasmius palmivorus]|uniref:Uncharacterized protein n=1 Tax=Paramarasmius palmivorus TaxID=297713 RepID=A0AAW0CIS9_9AGAR
MPTLPKILPVRLPRWVQSTVLLVLLRIIRLEMVVEVSVLSRPFSFSFSAISSNLRLATTSFSQWMVEHTVDLAIESLLSKIFTVVLAYMVITFTIFFTLFATLFTLTLLKTMSNIFSPRRLKQALHRKAALGALPIPALSETTDATHLISTDTSTATPSSSKIVPEQHQAVDFETPFVSPTPSFSKPPRKPLSSDLEQTLSPSLRPTPLPPHDSIETKLKVLPSGMAIDMERRRARELTNSVYFRINLPEGITSSYRDFALGESSSYKLLSRAPDSVDPNDYRLWLRHPSVKGTFEFEYDFRTTHRVRDLFPEMENFRGNNFRIRIPNFFQTAIDILDSFVGERSEGHMDNRDAVALSEAVVQCDADDHRWSATSGWTYVPAGNIAPRAVVHDSDLHSFDQEAQIRAPSLRQFAFKGISFQQQDHSVLLPSEVNHLPFNELICIRLENMQISFNDCRKVVDQCPLLETMYLVGGDIGKPDTEWDKQNGLFNDRTVGNHVSTSLTRLEIHGCNVDIWPLLQGLTFRPAPQRTIVLNLSVEGANHLKPTINARRLKGISELQFPGSLLLHPNIVNITSSLSGLGVAVREYVI